MSTTFPWVEVSSANPGRSEVRPTCCWPSHRVMFIMIPTGSGSTYVYGYCDATYQDGWGRDQTVEFVKNSTFTLCPCPNFPLMTCSL